MLSDHISWSRETLELEQYKKDINKLYEKALDIVRGGKLYGREININNPKEVIAALGVLAEDFNLFHEKF